MFIGIGTNNGFRKLRRSGMEPFVCSPIRHAAPDGAWFSGGWLSYKHAAPNGADVCLIGVSAASRPVGGFSPPIREPLAWPLFSADYRNPRLTSPVRRYLSFP